jgi:hypothetical protein
MPDNTFDVKGGSNQILPNATEAKQNIYIGDSAIKIALQQSGGAVDNDIAEKNHTKGTSSELVKHQSPQSEVHVSQKGSTMKVAILHLSDLHIEKDNYQWLLKKAEQMVPAVWNDFYDCGKIIIVVTGDITAAGTEEQYGYAKEFFRTLLREIAKRGLAGKELENKIICVPGNHDCNYDKESGARLRLLNSMRSNQDEIDDSIYAIISSVQDEYRAFAKEIMIEKDFSLGINNNITVKAGEKTILFRLYNTAWMSVKKEEQGSIVLPMEMVEQECGDADIAISLFHHHYGWITPGFDNNKNRFRKHIMRSSNMALYGHEHTSSSSQVRDNFDGEVINEFQGGSLCMKQQAGPRGSSFNSFVVDLDSFQCTVRSYVYTEGLYVCRKEETVDLNRERKTDEFRHSPDFMKSLKKMSIPIHNSENVKMTLDEFFVYPDLERMNTRQVRVDEDFTDSSSILDDKQFRLVMLEGDDQSGKTSLLNMYYIRFVDRYMYPVFIKGKNIINDNLNKVVASAFADQYNKEDLDKYTQYDKERKILLVDNFDECQLNDTLKKRVIDMMLERFSKVIITTKENEGVSSSYYLMEKKETLMARIKPLGHVKRNELVKKFYTTYDANASTLKQQTLLEQVKAGFDMVENFLGKEYMPSYPIYILSILLSNTKLQSSSLERTSYGYCYGALITCALMTVVDDKAKIDRYYNVLTSLAYFIYKKKGKPISEDEFQSFYEAYQEQYHAQGYKETKTNLLKCNLLRCTDDYYYKFSYNYIFYYLVAKYMAEHIHDKNGLDDIMDLCVDIHDEQKANILIFIAHHIKAPQFIEATQLALISALDTQKPVTLDRNDDYYKLVNELCESLKKEIVAPGENIDPEKEREKMLQKRDEHEKHLPKEKVNPNDLPVEIQNMNKSLRSIEVVGQIVKNRQGSLPKTDIKAMVKEMYETAFRTISYFGAIIESERSQVVEDVVKNKKEGETNDEIKKKIDSFFEVTSLNFCLFVFSKVINSVGNKELRSTFKQIADEIGTPAAKLVSFSIISCYSSKIAITELEDLVEELRDNPVAMSIIRARVRSYLYHNYVPINERQKIIKTVNLDPRDSEISANRLSNRLKR